MKILVLGVVGMLGNTVFRLLGQSTEIEVVGTARSTDVAQFFDRRIAGNLEIAIVNDGSADGGETEAIALERVRQHPDKVKYRAKRNGGVASALNCALEIATGDYFAWLSHDDIHLPHKTAAQIDYFAEIGMSDVCLFSNYALIDPEGRRLATTRHSVSDFVDHPRKAFPTGALNGCTLLIPMWIMRKYAPFDESLRYSQDYDLWNKILRDCDFMLQPDILTEYRVRPDQGSNHKNATVEGNALWKRILRDHPATDRAFFAGNDFRFFSEMRKFLALTPYREAEAFAANLSTRHHSRGSGPQRSLLVPSRRRPGRYVVCDDS